MSAKWRALQHRHRYTYSAVVFPQSYTDALTELHIDHATSSKYYSELKELVALNSTYAQVNHAKRVASAFGDVLVNGTEDLVSEAARFYLEILFLENSLPLHRTLVSVLAKSRNFHSLIANCFRLLCDEYGGVNGKGKRFCVSRVALSLMSSPKLGYLVEIIEACAVLVALDAVSGLDYIVSETNDWSRPSPIVMEQCQEALSCMYYLLQRFHSKFNGSNFSGSDLLPDDSNILRMIFATILSILTSQAFSRDCFVAAGVSFCAALQACLGPEELGCAIMEGIFFQKNCSLAVCSCNEVKDAISKVPFKGDLYSEIRNFSVLSRLCLIRGILTAVPRTVLNIRFLVPTYDVNGFHANGGKSNTVQTILYDGILPELCRNCENPTDSHFNFHALTVLQICLQQIKTSIQANLCDTPEDYDPISEDMGTRILSIIWNNLEDPLSQTVKQVHLIFDLFLDIQSTLHWSKGSERIKLSLERIASDLLCLGPRCKGRYVPLASLTKRLGAKTILDMSSNLLFETIWAFIDDDVCCAATTFLKCFLECLRDEYWSSDGIETGYAKYRGCCLPSVLSGLASGISKLRSNLNTYALPVLLELDVDAIFPMLAFVSVGQGDVVELVYPELSYTCMPLRVEQQVAILVSLLKVSRLLALIEGDIDGCENFPESQKAEDPRVNKIDHFAVFCIKGIKFKILTEWLVLALTHVDEPLRIDAAESLFLNPKTSSLPSHLELSLMKEAVPLNMRCCSTAFQMKWSSMFRKFFSRVRTALERQIKQGVWQPLAYCDSNGVSPYKGTEETTVNKAESLFNFMKWMSSFLFFSCYPSAPYERKIMAMELILIMINVWSIIPPSQGKSDSNTSDPSLCPYDQGFTLPDSTLLLVGSVIDSWDRLREYSFHILLHFPTPLSGIYSPDMVQKIIKWAKELVCSPRVRESDAGALTLRLIFRKYVLELGWMVRPSSNFVSFYSHSEMLNGDVQNSSSSSPVMEYVRSLIDWLHVSVEEGESDLSESCQKSFVHGVLLTLRYTFEELDWNSHVVLSNLCEMRLALEKLLQLIMRTTSLALWVVSADAWYLCEDMDDMVDNDVFSSEVPVDLDVSVSALEHDMNSKLVRDVRQEVRQSEQIVMVGCWLAMKEISLLLGTIIRKIPLPTSDSLKPGDPFPDAGVTLIMESDIVLDLKQLETIGNHFLEVLLKMKHNGAIDKTRAGFTALCNRLLCSNDPRLCKLTESWMEQLMERTVAKGQTVDDLLRRSAGIPAAFIALFLSEPEGTPKRLLPRALRWLIEVANKSLLDQNYFDTDSSNSLSIKSNQPNVSQLSSKMDASERTSKIRDEGVVPTVHAFNVLRATFNDTNLATDTSGFAAEALIISIRSFSSTYWEVRNSACLAYTALVRRMIGFLNIQKRDSARRALTGLEFFHRYPSLHPFLFNELRVATELLNDNSAQHPESNLAKVVHPSLCPMLILLSRLKPSAIASETGDNLDPFLFMPFIRRCSIQSNYRIRVLASRALTGLVSNEKLPIVLLDIASGLPCTESQMIMASDSYRPASVNDEKPTVSLNSIHGTLLQMISLLEINCVNLADFSKINQIIGDLIQALVMRSWIGRPRLCPCPAINSSFLRVLDNMLSIARMFQMSKNIGPIWNLLWELSSECLDLDATQGVPYYDPTIVEFRKQGTVSYFNCVFQASKDDAEEDSPMQQQCSSPALHFVMIPEREDVPPRFQQRLILSMSDASYEVRIATLKWLLVVLKATESGMGPSDKSMAEISIAQWFKTNLQTTLMKLLVTEKNKKCTYYILRILFTWNLLQFQKPGSVQCGEAVYIGEMDCDSVLQFWSELVSLYELTRHAKTQETIICCLGICMKRFADIFTSLVISNLEMKTTFESSKSDRVGRLAQMYDCVAFYVNLIDQHSASAEPVHMRRAAAESLLASGLLEQARLIGPLVLNSRIPSENPSTRFEPEETVNMYGHKILDIWFACIKLLEDEDVGLRRKLAKDVQKCLALKRSGEISKSAAVPSQVEKVTELSFEHLSSVFGNWLEYFNYLAQWVLNTANSVISTGDLVRRVFDKEIDNHHEEKLLICQICCSHLEKLPVSGSWAIDFANKQGIRNFLHTWRTRFRNQLISFANNHIGSQGEVDWIGSVGNHKDAFLPLYANLLGFYALSNCVFLGESGNGKSLLADVVELGEAINPFLRNPLIMNLYLLVVKSHEKMLVASPGHLIGRFGGEGSTWHGFDPYFLLR